MAGIKGKINQPKHEIATFLSQLALKLCSGWAVLFVFNQFFASGKVTSIDPLVSIKISPSRGMREILTFDVQLVRFHSYDSSSSRH
jgi:hypothetical protein